MKTAVLSLIIAVLVAVLGAFQFDKYLIFKAETERSILHLNEKIEDNVSTLNQKINSLEKNTPPTNVSSDLSQSPGQNTEQRQLSNYYSEAKEAWAINASYQLVRLAALQLQMDNDVVNAITLLQEASETLQPVTNAKATALRDALNAQIATLSSIKVPNLTEIWRNIGLEIEHVNSLPIRGDRNITTKTTKDIKGKKSSSEVKVKNVKTSVVQTAQTKDATETKEAEVAGTTGTSALSETTNTTENEHDTASEKGWRKALNNTWADIKNLVKIQRHTKPIEPLLSTTEERLAYENLTLLLEQARWAVLNRNTVIYQQSLQDAIHLLATQFATEDVHVNKMGEELDTLSKITLKPELPDLKHLLSLYPKKGEW